MKVPLGFRSRWTLSESMGEMTIIHCCVAGCKSSIYVFDGALPVFREYSKYSLLITHFISGWR
jgi:hypothetical protein